MTGTSGTEPQRWGPEGAQAAVSITFDNLGEAAEIEQGLWPSGRPLGSHPSVTEALPWILGLLDELELRATFFIEGVNTEVYPEAILSIANAGHEIGYHAWRHEQWGVLSHHEQARLLDRGVKTLGRLGIRPRGFRPPGGQLTPSSLTLLKNAGFDYCSPEGESTSIKEDIAILPFQWQLVDAYYYYAPFGALREAHGDSKEQLPTSLLRERMLSGLYTAIRDKTSLRLLFHPFLLLEVERRKVIHEVLNEVCRLVQTGNLWCASCGEVADYVVSAMPDSEYE